MEAYPLRTAAADGHGRRTDRRPAVARSTITGLDGLAPWLWCVEFVRRSSPDPTIGGIEDLVEDSIKGTDAAGTDQPQLARVLDALDDGRPVAFYGWWPTAELAGVSDILGVDAMDVPPPDRKRSRTRRRTRRGRPRLRPARRLPRRRLPDRPQPVGERRVGDAGDGYLPFTYLRTYATACARSAAATPSADGRRTTPQRPRQAERRPVAPRSTTSTARRDVRGRSDRPADLAAGPLLRSALVVHAVLLREPRRHHPGQGDLRQVHGARAVPQRALERHEPYGVWGGEFLYEGAIVTHKRGRGRPPRLRCRPLVDEVTGMPVVA